MANKVYGQYESAITFKASGGTVLFTPTSVANNAGRISDRYDRGGGAPFAKPTLYIWRVVTKAGAALAVGTALEVYLATSDGTSADGNQGTSDAAFSAADKRRNLQYLGALIADSTSSGEVQIASGLVEIRERYISVVWWNTLGQSLSGTAGDHSFTLTPVPDEIQ